jgi:hypothetical protein
MEGIQLDSIIAVTGPGMLRQATRAAQGDRIVRIIDPRYCDLKFRRSLANLTGRQYARMFRIENEGWLGLQYGIVYHPDSSWEPLATHFQRLHWRSRLLAVKEICDVVELWHNGPAHPLGLNLYNVVMAKDAGRWFPWLLPSPPVDYTSPCDLFGASPAIISATAPEVIRGVRSQPQAQDMYALGTLAIYALGCKEAPEAVDNSGRIEAQVCGAYLTCELKASDVEPFLQDSEALHRLVRVIQRYTYISPDARPNNANDLAAACMAAFEATDPKALANLQIRQHNLNGAHSLLEWGFKNFGEDREGRLLATNICEALENFPQALKHLEVAGSLLEGLDLDDLQRRVELRSKYLQTLTAPAPGSSDSEGDLLLRDVELLKKLPPQALSRRNMPYLSAALVYRRRQNLELSAQELYTATDIERSDMHALWLYGECLRDLGDSMSVAQVVAEAQRRIALMTMNHLMAQEDAHQWQKRFALLLQA